MDSNENKTADIVIPKGEMWSRIMVDGQEKLVPAGTFTNMRVTGVDSAWSAEAEVPEENDSIIDAYMRQKAEELKAMKEHKTLDLFRSAGYFRAESSDEWENLGDVVNPTIAVSGGYASPSRELKIEGKIEGKFTSGNGKELKSLFDLDRPHYKAVQGDVTIQVPGVDQANKPDWVRQEEQRLTKHYNRVFRRRNAQSARLRLFNKEEAEKFVANVYKHGPFSQAWLKSHPCLNVRAANLELKRQNSRAAIGIDLVAANAHEHGSRHMRRKVSHDIRKGTKQLAAGKTVRLDDSDIVALHGRVALHVLSQERYDAAVKKLTDNGVRRDLAVKDGFRQTLDALASLFRSAA